MRKQPHILLVDDDAFLSHIHKMKFEMEGFKVSLAEDGEAGVSDAKKKKPDIILLDVLMPKMDGFQALAKLKKTKETAHIPVILLTNLGQKKEVARGFTLGAADYLIKAHSKPSETVEKVKRILKY